MTVSPETASSPPVAAGDEPYTDAPRERNVPNVVAPDPERGNGLPYLPTAPERRRAALRLMIARLRKEAP